MLFRSNTSVVDFAFILSGRIKYVPVYFWDQFERLSVSLKTADFVPRFETTTIVGYKMALGWQNV